MKKLLLCILGLLGLLVTAQGQNQRQIKGRVVLATDTLRPLPYVQVINRSNGNGTVSDLDGYYVMPITEDDKIEFRMIGYHDTLLTVSQLRQLNYHFAMKERVVTLRPVTIRGQKQVYKPFAPPERKSDDPYVGYRSVKPSGLDPVDQKIGLATTGSGAALEGAITEFANLFSKKAKQRKKISALKERAREEATEYQVILRIWHYQEQYEKMYYRDM